MANAATSRVSDVFGSLTIILPVSSWVRSAAENASLLRKNVCGSGWGVSPIIQGAIVAEMRTGAIHLRLNDVINLPSSSLKRPIGRYKQTKCKLWRLAQ